MKIIYNSLIPFKGFLAINLFGVTFARKGARLTHAVIRHERIHTAQMKELFYLFFYIFYFLEWIFKLFKYGSQSYKNLSFEREAYQNTATPMYLQHRKRYAFLKYF
ncbi:MAG: hypothetical protein LBN93_00535 [Candidatus Symbiothrix sp.]|jgi:hypothetical protein|nr:hypothetical protein [Candidatus Symbiothrix sp.]